MIDLMSPRTNFEISVCNVFRILIGQMKNIKLDQVKLQESTMSSHGVLDEQLTDISKTAAMGEQYHRTDPLTDGKEDRGIGKYLTEPRSKVLSRNLCRWRYHECDFI